MMLRSSVAVVVEVRVVVVVAVEVEVAIENPVENSRAVTVKVAVGVSALHEV
jgi:hypothetical protein